MGFLKAILGSKKAGAAVVGVATQLLTALGLDPAVADAATQILMAYIASQGVVDLGLALKGSKEE